MTTDLRDLFKGTGQLDEKSVNALLKAIKNNYDNKSFDYLKFRQSVISLLKLDMDQPTSYKSAFATASTMGLSKESLLKSADRYIYALERERESFAEALLKQKEIKVDGRKSEVQDLVKKIEDHKNKMKELEREIDIFQNRIDTVDQDVEAAQLKINDTKDKFIKVFDTMTSEIKEDINSIKQHLQ